MVYIGDGTAEAGGGFGIVFADGGGCKAMLPCDAAAAARAVTGFPAGGGGGGGGIWAGPDAAVAGAAACAFRCAKRASSCSIVIDAADILHRLTICCASGRATT